MARDALVVQITDYSKSLSPYYLIPSQMSDRVLELTVEYNHANRQNEELKNPNSISFLILFSVPNPSHFFLSYPVGRLSCLY